MPKDVALHTQGATLASGEITIAPASAPPPAPAPIPREYRALHALSSVDSEGPLPNRPQCRQCARRRVDRFEKEVVRVLRLHIERRERFRGKGFCVVGDDHLGTCTNGFRSRRRIPGRATLRVAGHTQRARVRTGCRSLGAPSAHASRTTGGRPIGCAWRPSPSGH